MDRKAPEKAKMGRVGDRPYWVMVLSIFVRAIHQVGAAVFLTSFLFKNLIGLPRVYVIIVSVSGIVLVGTELLRHRQFLKELIGVSTFAKIVILGLAFHGWVPSTVAVLVAFVLASVCSHAPKTLRHRLLY
jgi:hypothetical protein